MWYIDLSTTGWKVLFTWYIRVCIIYLYTYEGYG